MYNLLRIFEFIKTFISGLLTKTIGKALKLRKNSFWFKIKKLTFWNYNNNNFKRFKAATLKRYNKIIALLKKAVAHLRKLSRIIFRGDF